VELRILIWKKDHGKKLIQDLGMIGKHNFYINQFIHYSEITNSPNELRFIDYDTGKITTELSKLRP